MLFRIQTGRIRAIAIAVGLAIVLFVGMVTVIFAQGSVITACVHDNNGNVRIVNSVLGPGVHVEEKATVENSVIWSHTRISGLAEVKDSVIGRSCHIGRNASVSAGTVLGDKALLPDYSKV